MKDMFNVMGLMYPLRITLIVDNAKTHAPPPPKDSLSVSNSSRRSRWSEASETSSTPSTHNATTTTRLDRASSPPIRRPEGPPTAPARRSSLRLNNSAHLDELEREMVSCSEEEDNGLRPQSSRWNVGIDPHEVSPEGMKLRRGRHSIATSIARLKRPRPKLGRWESDSNLLSKNAMHSAAKGVPRSPARLPSLDGKDSIPRKGPIG